MKNSTSSLFRRFVIYYVILSTFVWFGLVIYFAKGKKQEATQSIPTMMRTINPTTEEEIFACKRLTSTAITARIATASTVQKAWAQMSFSARAVIIKRVGKILRDKQEKYATMITQSMGKPITEARAEIIKCAKLCDYYATHAATFLATEKKETATEIIYESYEPLGVIFAVMPWNFPFWQVFRFAIPNLMAGNVGLLKHASNVVHIGLAIEDLFIEAGCPKGVFQCLPIHSSQTELVINDPRVAGVTLTGSEQAGSAVAAAAGKALKPTVLELGGSDPFIVYPDADISKAVQHCIASRCSNTGQVCIAAKRIILIGKIKEAFIKEVITHVKAHYGHGDPMLEKTRIGPMARGDLRDSLHHQVTQTIADGATCLLGGSPIQGKGYFYPVTVLTDIPKGSPAYQDELFGPVIAIFHVETEEEALALANDTLYGLAATLFTADVEHARDVAKHLFVGTCYINGTVVSDQRLPFGGVKKSGYGRELGPEGIRAFMNKKVVVIKK